MGWGRKGEEKSVIRAPMSHGEVGKRLRLAPEARGGRGAGGGKKKLTDTRTHLSILAARERIGGFVNRTSKQQHKQANREPRACCLFILNLTFRKNKKGKHDGGQAGNVSWR